jgi:hypothetical protein
MSNHLGLNFNLVELLSGVDTNDATNHLRNDDHVSKMCLDEVGLLIRSGFLLSLSELLDQSHRLSLQSSVESTSSTGMDDISELLG